jgi:hypothetical protein
MNAREAIERLMAAFPNQRQAVNTLALYTEKLAHVPAEDLAQAVEQCIEHCTYWPRLAELLGRARIIAGARVIRSDGAARRAQQQQASERYEGMAAEEGISEMPRVFRAPSGCATLRHESWSPDELLSPVTGKQSLRNSIHARAQMAMRDVLEQRQAEAAARKSA